MLSAFSHHLTPMAFLNEQPTAMNNITSEAKELKYRFASLQVVR